MANDPKALPSDADAVIFIAKDNDGPNTLARLIRSRFHVLVIDHPYNYLKDCDALWKWAEEAGSEIWFSLWNAYQPGLIQLIERFTDPEHLFFERNINPDTPDFEDRLKQITAEELLLALYWLNARLKTVHYRQGSQSKLLHIETLGAKPASIRLSWAVHSEFTRRMVSSDHEGLYEKTEKSANSSVISENQAVSIPADHQQSAADLLLLGFVRSLRGLAHRPAFKLYDLFQHRSILRYI